LSARLGPGAARPLPVSPNSVPVSHNRTRPDGSAGAARGRLGGPGTTGGRRVTYHTGQSIFAQPDVVGAAPSGRPRSPVRTSTELTEPTMHVRQISGDDRPAGHSAATGDQWVLGHGHQRVVVTEVGATLRSFTVSDRPVIDGFEADEWCHGSRGQVLAPWPNRLGDGRYRFGGIDAQAPLDEPERRNAIHGLVRWMPWRMVGRAQNRVTLACVVHPTPGYPFTLGLQVEYRLGRDGLTVATEAENQGDDPLPFGLGFHPYLSVDGASVDMARLTVPAGQRLVTDDRGLPTGRAAVTGTEFDFTGGRIIGTSRLDTGYTELRRDADGTARVRLETSGPAGRTTTLWADERFPYLMIYTGDTLADPIRRRKAVAVEPMTCPPDALRTGTDLIVLAPGETWRGLWGITLG